MQKKYEIDPVTGLKLEVLDPLPSQHTAIESALDVSQEPVMPPAETPMLIEPFEPERQAVLESVRAGDKGTPYRGSMFDRLLRTVMGVPDSKLEQAGDVDELRARQARRRRATDLSRVAAQDPGAAHMEIPDVPSGKGLGESLDKPLQLAAGAVSALFGKGKRSGVG